MTAPTALTPDLRMSGREIAELTGVRHDNVKRTIEAIAAKGIMRLPQIEEVSNPGLGPAKIAVYNLDKRSSLIVVAQLCPEFTARLIDRWAFLEQQEATRQRSPVSTVQIPDFTNPAAAARAWADQYDRASRLAAERELLAPKAALADRLTDAQGQMTMEAAAKALGTGRTRLFRLLREPGVFTNGGLPKQHFLDRKYFDVRSSLVWDRWRGTTSANAIRYSERAGMDRHESG